MFFYMGLCRRGQVSVACCAGAGYLDFVQFFFIMYLLLWNFVLYFEVEGILKFYFIQKEKILLCEKKRSKLKLEFQDSFKSLFFMLGILFEEIDFLLFKKNILSISTQENTEITCTF